VTEPHFFQDDEGITVTAAGFYTSCYFSY
jgi:hypothetical protein